MLKKQTACKETKYNGVREKALWVKACATKTNNPYVRAGELNSQVVLWPPPHHGGI